MNTIHTKANWFQRRIPSWHRDKHVVDSQLDWSKHSYYKTQKETICQRIYNYWLMRCCGSLWTFCGCGVTITSGVFKGRRARHLPRAPLFGSPPLRYYGHKFSLFLVKDVLFTHVMCYKENHKQVFCFQRAPYRNCNVQVLCFQRGPNSNWNMYVLCC